MLCRKWILDLAFWRKNIKKPEEGEVPPASTLVLSNPLVVRCFSKDVAKVIKTFLVRHLLLEFLILKS